mmetsp:Transcript_6200/g.17967  ORF Transcript_6200/g.17967 Transcript_6200/m.17967 type:complete len:283 (+) Transcript_6200:439-1287(+)
MQCHGIGTDSVTRRFASSTAEIARLAASTASAEPRMKISLPCWLRAASMAAPVAARMRLISSPPLPITKGMNSTLTSIFSEQSALYCSTASSAASALPTARRVPLMVAVCMTLPSACLERAMLAPVSFCIANIACPPLPSSMLTCCDSTSSVSSTRSLAATAASISRTTSSTAAREPRTLTALSPARSAQTPSGSLSRSVPRPSTASATASGTATVRTLSASRLSSREMATRAVSTACAGPLTRTVASSPLPMSSVAPPDCDWIRCTVAPPLPSRRPFCSGS